MAIQVRMPQMGESVFEGTLTKWLKKVGDPIARDEPLFEISTDKVDSEIPSPASGILSEILVPEGKTIQIHTVLAVIREPGEAEAAAPHASSENGGAPAAAPQSGSAQRETVPDASAASIETAAQAASEIRPQDVRTSPLVRKIARDRHVDLREVRGTGLEGRITKDDIFQYLAQRDAAHTEAPPPPAGGAVLETAAPVASSGAAAPPELPRFIGETETVPMTPMRKAIAEHMVLSKRTSAHVNTFFEVDMTPLVALREKQKAEFLKREGIPLTYTPFFAKALVDVVREFPIFNASVSGDTIVYKKPIHLGIAVALESGLLVPVVRNAHLKSFTGIALSIHDLAERARTKRLKPEDVQNGTITMTNPGSYGGLFATPIINQPQVAILGVGAVEKRPVVIQDAIAIRSMVYLSLTFDHRVIDGAVADQFMARLKERLQGWNQWID